MSNFSNFVRRHFDYLTTEYGFKCEIPNEHIVTFSNGAIFFQVGYGEYAGEVGLTLDRFPPVRYFPFEFYLKAFFPDVAVQLGTCSIRSDLELDVEVGKLSRLLKTYGQSIINGQSEVFDQLAATADEILKEKYE